MNAIVAIPKIYKWSKEAIKKDLHNRFDLLEPWLLPKIDPTKWVIPDTETATLCFVDNRPMVKPYKNTDKVTHCNGATLSPEQCLIPVTVGALIHDVAYDLIEIFAKEWGWTEAEVRRLFDEIFGNVLMSLACQIKNPVKRWAAVLVARTYYTGVRWFGGVAHSAFKVLSLVMLCFLCGCKVPPIWDWQEPMQQPSYSNSTVCVWSVMQPTPYIYNSEVDYGRQ